MDLDVVNDLIEYAEDSEIEERRWREWIIASPIGALAGVKVPYKPYTRSSKKTQATDETITDIARAFGLDDPIKAREE